MDSEERSGPVLLAKRIVNRVGRPLGINPFPRAFANAGADGSTDRAEVFERIYQSNFWGSSESRSGVGSEGEFSRAYGVRLRALIEQRGFKRLFDAPCGDLNWMVDIARDPAIDYAGGDISPGLVGELRRQYPDVGISLFDICADAFPAADVWHCRDCLFHLPFADIDRALRNFVGSGIPFALLTTHRARWLHRNLDVPLGGFRFLDLERAPIGLPPAQSYIPDYRKGSDFPRYVGLWPRDAIAEAIGAGR